MAQPVSSLADMDSVPQVTSIDDTEQVSIVDTEAKAAEFRDVEEEAQEGDTVVDVPWGHR
jgi:hypothetical protein